MAKIIGIDLGNHQQLRRGGRGGKPVVIPNAGAAHHAVCRGFHQSGGERLVGEPAKRQAVTNAPAPCPASSG